MVDSLLSSDYRCDCGKLLLKGIFFDASIEVKCRKCGKINKIGEIRLLNDSSHYFFTINREGYFTSMSNSVKSILGYNDDEIIGKHFNLIDPIVPRGFIEKFTKSETLMNGDDYIKVETNHVAKNGKLIPVIVVLKIQKLNNKEKNLLVLAELKELKIVENHEFIEHYCDFYFCIDKEGIITCVSNSACYFFGISQIETIGKLYFNFLPKDLREKAEQSFRFFSSNGSPYKKQNTEGVFINNKKVKYEVYFSPKSNNVGDFVGYYVLGWIK